MSLNIFDFYFQFFAKDGSDSLPYNDYVNVILKEFPSIKKVDVEALADTNITQISAFQKSCSEILNHVKADESV